MELARYTADLRDQWNCFNTESKNGSFLFSRDYMDYHSDRYTDGSLLFFRKGKLMALFPCNMGDECAYSHQGLTFGGFILSTKNTIENVIQIFNLSNQYFTQLGVRKVIYKPSPYIYHSYPSQEDLYALFRLKSSIIGRNISTVIPLNQRLAFTESRLSGLRKALANNMLISYNENLAEYWMLLKFNLQNKYKTQPVHSLNEIELLMQRFPQNIKLYCVNNKNKLLGGALLYLHKNIIRVQYIASSEDGKKLGALDFLFHTLINQTYRHIDFFDMGSSNEGMGSYLNSQLIFQKEGFGGRGVCFDTYEYSTNNQITL